MDAVQLHTALDSLERKAAAKIEECYNIFFENVKETINALMQSSISHVSDIGNVLKIEIAEVKKMCIVDDVETAKQEVKASQNKYLKLKPINLLKGNAPQRSCEQQNLLAKHDDKLMSLAENNAADNIITSILELHGSQNTRIGKATTVTQNDQSAENLQRKVNMNINISGNGENRVYECSLCDHRSYKKRHAYEHIANMHNVDSLILSKYKCTQCSYIAKTSFLLTNHEKRVHDNSQMHQCQKCHGIFKNRYLLRRHLCPNEFQYVYPSTTAFIANE